MCAGIHPRYIPSTSEVYLSYDHLANIYKISSKYTRNNYWVNVETTGLDHLCFNCGIIQVSRGFDVWYLMFK